VLQVVNRNALHYSSVGLMELGLKLQILVKECPVLTDSVEKCLEDVVVCLAKERLVEGPLVDVGFLHLFDFATEVVIKDLLDHGGEMLLYGFQLLRDDVHFVGCMLGKHRQLRNRIQNLPLH
jgi:hypothetical protein